MSFYLAIVSPLDSPLYELSFPSSRPNNTTNSSTSTSGSSGGNSSFPSWSTFTAASGADLGAPDGKVIGGNLGLVSTGGVGAAGGIGERHLLQMIAHMSLDGVDEVIEGTGSLYLKNIEKHNEWSVSAFIATSVKFILLHDHKNDDGIRLFFLDLWELYVKTLLNPFHTVNTPIRNPVFETKVRAAAKRNL